MAVYVVRDKRTIAQLFDGWDETFIWSCLQDCMGMAWVDSLRTPHSAQISLGDFCCFGGEANIELAAHMPENLRSNFAILVPQNQQWEQVIEQHFGDKATRITRFATKKEGDVFDRERLQSFVGNLPVEYELRQVDRQLCLQILSTEWSADLCCNYPSFEEYQRMGLGIVAIKDGEIVSGASSYISYEGGIEIEIDTREDHRRKGLALACGAKLILECLDRGWYPSWDAHNPASLALAEKLGYTLEKEYTAYEVCY